MKKIILSVAAIFAFGFANAQDKKESAGGQTSKGKWLIEANTGFGAIEGANTSLGYSSQGNLKRIKLLGSFLKVFYLSQQDQHSLFFLILILISVK